MKIPIGGKMCTYENYENSEIFENSNFRNLVV